MAKVEEWVRKGEWSEVRVTRSKRGYVVRKWSGICGDWSHRAILVPWSALPAGVSTLRLDGVWNVDYQTQYGDLVVELALHSDKVRVLRRGHIVH